MSCADLFWSYLCGKAVEFMLLKQSTFFACQIEYASSFQRVPNPDSWSSSMHRLRHVMQSNNDISGRHVVFLKKEKKLQEEKKRQTSQAQHNIPYQTGYI